MTECNAKDVYALLISLLLLLKCLKNDWMECHILLCVNYKDLKFIIYWFNAIWKMHVNDSNGFKFYNYFIRQKNDWICSQRCICMTHKDSKFGNPAKENWSKQGGCCTLLYSSQSKSRFRFHAFHSDNSFLLKIFGLRV